MAAGRARLITFPPQHGAWAFLIVPVILAACLGAATWVGLLFAVAWITAYPATYFGGRAAVARVRRGAWTGFARREAKAALPWAAVALVSSLGLIAIRPWSVIPGLVFLAIWGVSIALTWAGRERGISNDLLLVVMAALSTPFMWAVAADQPDPNGIPSGVWIAAVVCLVFFAGSVVHVKSLIREATDRRWHWASVTFHVLALVAMTAVSWWLAIPFGAALARTLIMRPGLRPGRIGAVEAVVCVLVVICTVLAVR